MFSLLTLVAFGIIGTLLVGIQYYALHTHSWGLSKLWTKSWMLFFLFMTVVMVPPTLPTSSNVPAPRLQFTSPTSTC